MKQAKKIPALMEHTHTHRKIEKREKVRGKERGRDGVAACPGRVGGIGLGPWWRQMQGHRSRM